MTGKSDIILVKQITCADHDGWRLLDFGPDRCNGQIRGKETKEESLSSEQSNGYHRHQRQTPISSEIVPVHLYSKTLLSHLSSGGEWLIFGVRTQPYCTDCCQLMSESAEEETNEEVSRSV